MWRTKVACGVLGAAAAGAAFAVLRAEVDARGSILSTQVRMRVCLCVYLCTVLPLGRLQCLVLKADSPCRCALRSCVGSLPSRPFPSSSLPFPQHPPNTTPGAAVARRPRGPRGGVGRPAFRPAGGGGRWSWRQWQRWRQRRRWRR
jgi:hypothetical protein